MKLKLISALAASLLSAAPVFAETITLDFEGSSGFINNFYNGGTDIPANYSNTAPSSGINYGISFGFDALAFSNDPEFPSYSNAPTNGTIMSTAPQGDSALTVNSGFTGLVSFYYSSDAYTLTTVNIWSGANATGSILASFALTNNAQTNCNDTAYCHWDLAQLDIGNNIGRSIEFGGSGAGFDNVTVNAVPVPAAAWLMGSALLGLGGISRRRTQR